MITTRPLPECSKHPVAAFVLRVFLQNLQRFTQKLKIFTIFARY